MAEIAPELLIEGNLSGLKVLLITHKFHNQFDHLSCKGLIRFIQILLNYSVIQLQTGVKKTTVIREKIFREQDICN